MINECLPETNRQAEAFSELIIREKLVSPSGFEPETY